MVLNFNEKPSLVAKFKYDYLLRVYIRVTASV